MCQDSEISHFGPASAILRAMINPVFLLVAARQREHARAGALGLQCRIERQTHLPPLAEGGLCQGALSRAAAGTGVFHSKEAMINAAHAAPKKSRVRH